MSKDEKKKLSSLETWNLLTEKAAKVALNEVNFKENSFKDSAKAGAMTSEMGNFKKLSLKDDIEKSFDKELISQNKKYDLDPKTVNAFNKNKEKYFEQMLAKTEISGGQENVGKAIENIRKDIKSFKDEVTVDPKNIKSNWKKVADFCESRKMDGLAKFCHEKHAQTVAKDISKELNENLKDHKKSSPESGHYKPLAAKQKGRE